MTLRSVILAALLLLSASIEPSLERKGRRAAGKPPAAGGTDYTARATAQVYVDFETGGSSICASSANGTVNLAEQGNLLDETTIFKQGAQSGDANGEGVANECRDGNWEDTEGNPFDNVASDATVAFFLYLPVAPTATLDIADTGPNGFRFEISSARQLFIHGTQCTSTAIPLTTWTHVMVALDVTPNPDEWECFVNGASTGTATGNVSVTNDLALFSDRFGNGGADVLLDDFLIVSETLGAADAAAMTADCAQGTCA